MKISVYKPKKVYPRDEDEYEMLCDIFNLPSLRYGYVEFIGEFSHYVTKSELKKQKKVYYIMYNEETSKWVEGLMLFGQNGEKLFAEIN